MRRLAERTAAGGRIHLLALGCFMLAASADAHETGFGHSVRTLYFSLVPEGVQVVYRLRLEPEEALAEMARMDADRNGAISDEERETWFHAKGARLMGNMMARQGERTVSVAFESFTLGHGLTQSYVYTLASGADRVRFEDGNLSHRPGIVRILHGDGVTVTVLEKAPLHHAGVVAVEVSRR